MGKGPERASAWVVLASVGVVALAGITLRVEPRGERAREQRRVAVRIERELRLELLRQRAKRNAGGALPDDAAAVPLEPAVR